MEKTDKQRIIFNLRGDDEDVKKLKKNSAKAGYTNVSNFVRNRVGLKELEFNSNKKIWEKK